MALHLFRDLERLKRDILTLGASVEEAVSKAITSLTDRKPSLAEEVMAGDEAIDVAEVELEEECLKVLALHQPFAADLRLVVTILKVNNDLERVGDLASNVAERALFLASQDSIPAHVDFPTMGEFVRKMLRESLDSLVRQDSDLAEQVRRFDDEVDQLHRGAYQTLQDLMLKDPSTSVRAIHLLSASRHLERIADLATNIAEDVIFMVRGEVVRHRPPAKSGQ